MHLKPSQEAINIGRVNDLEDRLAYIEQYWQEIPQLHTLQEQQKQIQQQIETLSRKLQELIDCKAKKVNIYI
jgi:uncharacterized coiled-coil protein SlyX